MSKALKKAGFKFVGPTTCYSLMQVCLPSYPICCHLPLALAQHA